MRVEHSEKPLEKHSKETIFYTSSLPLAPRSVIYNICRRHLEHL